MTYEYICKACGHEWEADQKITEHPLTECPECREHEAKRQISKGSGFRLADGGVGWAKNLYSK